MSALSDDEVIEWALEILNARIKKQETFLNNPDNVKNFLRLQTAHLEHEVFGMVYLDTKLRMIDSEIVFRGTLTQTAVYPREVLKLALRKNCAAIILYHNHPSGSPDPSHSDIELTKMLKQTLKMVDIDLVDHIIVCGDDIFSFAENHISPCARP